MVYTDEKIKLLIDGIDEYQTLLIEKKELNKRLTEMVNHFVDSNRQDYPKKLKGIYKKKMKKYVVAWYNVMTSKEVCAPVADTRYADLEISGEKEAEWMSKICADYKSNKAQISDANEVISNLVESTAQRVGMKKDAVKKAWDEYIKLKQGKSTLDEVSTLVALIESKLESK